MVRLLILLIVSGCLFPAFCQFYGLQSDWAGGDGAFGPVYEWYDEFYLSSEVSWSGYPGSLHLNGVSQHLICDHSTGARDVSAADINGDLYMDVIGIFSFYDDLCWWENEGGTGITWTEHTIAAELDPSMVFLCDLNGDGYEDIVTNSWATEEVTWFENQNGSGELWVDHLIKGNSRMYKAFPSDIDSDGDMDIVGNEYSGVVLWLENVDGSGTSWNEHIVAAGFGIYTGFAQDIDTDGDMDVLGYDYTDDIILWWENVDGTGTSWMEHTVEVFFEEPNKIYADDIDSDGDMDVICSSRLDALSWWENSDTSPGVLWTRHSIADNNWGVYGVCSCDIDDDGDADVLGIPRRYNSSAGVYDCISWWENVDGTGQIWVEHLVSDTFDDAESVYPADLTGEGITDILGAAYNFGFVRWQLDSYASSGTLESTVLEIQWPVDDHIIWGAITWHGVEPDYTDISFQVRSFTDTLNMGPWSDTITVSGTGLAGVLGEYDMYLQYKAILETEDIYTTPILDDVLIDWEITSIGETADDNCYQLYGAVPNPAFGYTAITFSVPEECRAELFLYDVAGRMIISIMDDYLPGHHQIMIDDLTCGIYFIKMVSGGFTSAQQFVVLD